MQQKEIDINKIKELPMFFIVGSPRSGTTMLRTIFDAHPNVSIPLENPFFLTFYKKYNLIKYWDKLTLESLFDEIINLKHKEYLSFAKWKMNNAILKENILKMEGHFSFSEITKMVFLNFNSIFPKNIISLIGDKNPAYSFVIPKILSVFPEAKFIHIIRDYRDHILSMQKVDFGSRLTPFTALKWRRCQKVIEKQKKIVPNRFVTIKYEELVTNTSENIKEICNFLSVDFLPDILNFHNYKEDFLITYKDDGIEQYHSSLMQPINTSKIKTWKVKMPEKEIKMADMVVGRWAEKYGYERKYNGTYPLLYLYLLPIYVHIIVQRFLGLFVRMLPHKAMNKVVYRNSIFEKLYEKIYIKLRGQKS